MVGRPFVDFGLAKYQTESTDFPLSALRSANGVPSTVNVLDYLAEQAKKL